MTIIESVGWVLVHFIWQGIAIALVLAALLSLTSAAQSMLRYVLSCAALVAMLAAAGVTASVVTAERTPVLSGAVSTLSESRAAEPSAPAEPNRQPRAGGVIERQHTVLDALTAALPPLRPLVAAAMPWLVTAWAAGVLLLSIRLAGGWWRTRRLRRDGVGPVPDWCHTSLAALATRLGVARPVSILSSVRVRVPIVLGHLRPVIVVPASVLAGLSTAQLEAIIAHELAHVRRHDYLVNLAQILIETLLFYHPAVWWVSRQIRNAREQCCDDLAVSVCSSRQSYVHALLGLEELKHEALKNVRLENDLLALGATDGPLLARARRLLLPSERGAAAPRLVASAIASSVVAAAVAGATFAADESVVPSTAIVGNAGSLASVEPTQEIPASSIKTAPDAAAPFSARWTWAERTAREGRYWIGYTISPLQTLPPVVYMDRSARIVGRNITFEGTFFASGAGGFRFPGRRLRVEGNDRVLKLLFAFDARRGAPVLTGVHASSLALPIDNRDLPVYWLGQADAAASAGQIDRLYKTAGTTMLQHDLIGAMGMHDTSAEIVGWLESRVDSGDPDDLRAEAVEWMAHHPIQRSIAALDRIARLDRVSRVRQEAAEALGDVALPEAVPALIALARELEDRDARLEAVEALGERSEPAARDALASIARYDPSLDIQREAVETLGELKDKSGLSLLIDLAQTHPDAAVRQEAIETIRDTAPAGEIVPVLKRIALADADPDVQEEAIDTLADLPDGAGINALAEIVREQPDTKIARRAVEALLDSNDPRARALFKQLRVSGAKR